MKLFMTIIHPCNVNDNSSVTVGVFDSKAKAIYAGANTCAKLKDIYNQNYTYVVGDVDLNSAFYTDENDVEINPMEGYRE